MNSVQLNSMLAVLDAELIEHDKFTWIVGCVWAAVFLIACIVCGMFGWGEQWMVTAYLCVVGVWLWFRYRNRAHIVADIHVARNLSKELLCPGWSAYSTRIDVLDVYQNDCSHDSSEWKKGNERKRINDKIKMDYARNKDGLPPPPPPPTRSLKPRRIK